MESLGKFEQFGGCYVSELLMPVLTEVESAFLKAIADPAFQSELQETLAKFGGRPTPITPMKNLSQDWGCDVVLKREDLMHGGSHKTNNVIGQGLLAKYLSLIHI